MSQEICPFHLKCKVCEKRINSDSPLLLLSPVLRLRDYSFYFLFGTSVNELKSLRMSQNVSSFRLIRFYDFCHHPVISEMWEGERDVTVNDSSAFSDLGDHVSYV